MKNFIQFKDKKKEKIIKSNIALISLINKQFWQSKIEPLYTFLFSAIFIAIYGAMNLESSFNFKTMLSGVVLMNVLSVGLNSMPAALLEFKNSVLLKRIGATNIKPWMFVMNVCVFYSTILFVSFFWAILWIVLIFGFTKTSSEILSSADGESANILLVNFLFGNETIYLGKILIQNIQWGGVIVSLIYNILLTIGFGVFVSSIAKSSVIASGMASIVFFLSMFLGGQLFPITSINANEPLRIFSYIAPFRYGTGLFNSAWAGENIFSITKDFTITNPFIGTSEVSYYKYDQYLNWFIPLIFMALVTACSIKFFKWTTR